MGKLSSFSINLYFICENLSSLSRAKMRRKIFFSLLLAILSQVIMALSEDNKGPSNLLVRKRRIIDHTYQKKRVTLRDIPYIVNIRSNDASQCGGSILSPNIILTAAHCVYNIVGTINVITDSEERHNGYHHVVKHLQMHPNYNRTNVEDDLALLYIEPAINLIKSDNRKIEFYNGPLHSGIVGTISGWGCTNIATGLNMYPHVLQATQVALVGSEECHQAHENIRSSAGKHLCTFHKAGQRGTCRGDDGGPFVIDGKLAGVISGYNLNRGQLPLKNKPDFYVNLAYQPYREWIVTTILHLERIAPSFGFRGLHPVNHHGNGSH